MNSQNMPSTLLTEDDGLTLPSVGSWSEDKHRKVSYYASMFCAAMKKNRDCLVFLDLFAGAGMARIKDSGKVIAGSPMLALGLNTPFCRYVFCDLSSDNCVSLRTRIDRFYPAAEAKVLQIDANKQLEEVFKVIPTFDASYTGLTFCFVDPFSVGNLKFKTLETIASRLYVDFMILIPSFMDIKRNPHHYTREENQKLDDFLGTREWRNNWEAESSRLGGFGVFIADQFGKRMQTLRYKYSGPEMFETIRVNQDKGLFLYHIGFFSRSDLGVKFWNTTRSNTTDQMRLAI